MTGGKIAGASLLESSGRDRDLGVTASQIIAANRATVCRKKKKPRC